MQRVLTLSLWLAMAFYVSCRHRDEIDPEAKTDDSSSLIIGAETPTDPAAVKSEEPVKTDGADQKPADNVPVKDTKPEQEPAKDPPIVIAPDPVATQRIESLSFSHSNGMCVQVNANGETNLQPCDGKSSGQKFLFSRSLDGRVQLKDTSSELCLAVGPASFFSDTLLLGEVCESKATQFFSVVDYGNAYSLKFDGNNTCVDAKSSGVSPGTRLILYKCSAVLNQKIKSVKK